MAGVKMQVLLRPFAAEEDFPVLVAIRNAVYPHNPTTVESARFQWQTLDPQRYHRERQVAADPGSGYIVGAASINHNPEMFHPDKYECGILVHPDHQGGGIGDRLWAWVEGRLRQRGAVLARGTVWEGYPHAVAFAAKKGFREKRRGWQSVLEAKGVDLAALAHRWARVREQGIVLTTLAEELRRDPECLGKLYDLARTSLRHTPLPDVPTDPPYEMFRQWVMESPRRLPEAFFIAREGDRYVGISFLEKGAEEGVLGQGLTATNPDYMGRGIAWALKLNTVQYAQTHGDKQIKTWNDTENQPMLSINLRLGFMPLPAWITMEREFTR